MLLMILGNVLYVVLSWLISLIPLNAGFLPQLNPAHILRQCAVGYSGVLFGLLAIENKLETGSFRSVFGFFSVPTAWFPVVLLLLWQFLVPHVSFLGHLTGLMIGQLYCFRCLNWAIPASNVIQHYEGNNQPFKLPSMSLYIENPGFQIDSSLSESSSTVEPLLPNFTGGVNQMKSWFSSLWRRGDTNVQGSSPADFMHAREEANDEERQRLLS